MCRQLSATTTPAIWQLKLFSTTLPPEPETPRWICRRQRLKMGAVVTDPLSRPPPTSTRPSPSLTPWTPPCFPCRSHNPTGVHRTAGTWHHRPKSTTWVTRNSAPPRPSPPSGTCSRVSGSWAPRGRASPPPAVSSRPSGIRTNPLAHTVVITANSRAMVSVYRDICKQLFCSSLSSKCQIVLSLDTLKWQQSFEGCSIFFKHLCLCHNLYRSPGCCLNSVACEVIRQLLKLWIILMTEKQLPKI